MHQYTIELTDAQDMALSYVTASQQEWISESIKQRCRIAMEEILSVALQKSVETGTPLPTNKEEIVVLAFQQGWVKTGAQRNAESFGA